MFKRLVEKMRGSKLDVIKFDLRSITFRAEIMPGRLSAERTFVVEDVLPNGRVKLVGLKGEFSLKSFV